MSTLQERLMNDLKTAMKEKDEVKKSVISIIRAGLKNYEIKLGRSLTENDEIAVLRTELKQMMQSLEAYQKADRDDLVQIEKQKIEVIESYLPKQMTEEEIEAVLHSLGIEKGANKGQVIGKVMKVVNGRADGRLVSQVVSDFLAE
jgi:uncharacterized protein